MCRAGEKQETKERESKVGREIAQEPNMGGLAR